jgi:small ligand-binding sensory domain FIST
VQFKTSPRRSAWSRYRARIDCPGTRFGGSGRVRRSCGRRIFGVPDHGASTIEELLGGIPLAGFFAAGEIGSIADRNALHAFTASMALFIDDTK